MEKLKQNPLVSVIIPTYNRAHLIEATIESVRQQTYPHLEIIIVDDASKDNTEEVVKAIADPRIRYICNETNQKASITRNNGVQSATGDYIAFLDSDDLWFPSKIELQLEAIQNHPEPERVVCYTQVKNNNGETVVVMPKRGIHETESVADYLFVYRGLMQTGTLMMPRELALKTPFKPGIVPYEDMDLCMKLGGKGAAFIFIEQPLIVWNNEKRSDRVTNSEDYLLPLRWIQEDWQDVISSKAMKGFLVHWIAPLLIEAQDNKIYAQQIIIDAALHHLISVKNFFRLTARVAIPKQVRQRAMNLTRQIFSEKSTKSPKVSTDL